MESPYIMKSDYRIIRSSDAQKVMQIKNEYEQSLRAMNDDLSREMESWKAYMGLNGESWPADKLQKLKDENRHAVHIDFLSPKVDTLAGTLVAEMPDSDWNPVEGQRNSGTEAVKHSYYNDKALSDGDDHMMYCIRDGLVHIGWLQITVSMKYGKPVIGFERVRPGYFVASQYWKSIDDRAMKEGYKRAYMLPEGIAFKYHSKHDTIMNLIRMHKSQGRDGQPTNEAQLKRQHAWNVGDEYQIIEYHWLEMVHTKRLVGVRINPETGRPSWMPFPVTDDRAKLDRFAEANNIDWETVTDSPYDDAIHRVTTICPDLDMTLLLEDKKSRIQIGGVPFFHFTVTRHEGRNKGIVPAILELNRINDERESLVNRLIEHANGGATAWDESIFKDPEEAQKWIKNANNPSHNALVDLSVMKGNAPYVRAQPNQYPSQILDQIGRMWDQALPMVSRVSDSMSSITESGKSGVLFEREYQVNRIANLLLDKGVKKLVKNIGDAYFMQWWIEYAGVEREVTTKDGERKITLNERIPLQNGKIAIRNAVEYTPRCRTIVTENVKSSTYQTRYRNIYSEMLKNTNAEMFPEQYIFAYTQFMQTMDLDEKAKGQLEALNQASLTRMQMKYISDVTGLDALAKQNMVTAAQAQQVLTQIMAQIRQMQQGMNQQPAPVEEQITERGDMVQQLEQQAGPINEPVLPAEAVPEAENQ